MPAVSNTTPLRHLIAIEQEQLLPQLFGEIAVPLAVHAELTHSRTPKKVSQRVQVPPDWYKIHEAPQVQVHGKAFPKTLDRGEQEAILLAEFLGAEILLIDDRLGRAVALSRNIRISGTLGVLESADAKRLLSDFPEILTKLKVSGFFLAEALEQRLLGRHRARRGLG
jgi:predicted nucleic acid-binding protein